MPVSVQPTVSIILKALNEEQRIAVAIESALAALADLDGEVILADLTERSTLRRRIRSRSFVSTGSKIAPVAPAPNWTFRTAAANSCS